LRPKSLGKGEVDVLVGTTEGGNEFLLGSFITSVNPKAEPFYLGKGDADYARIQNFTKGKDSIILAGEPGQYRFEAVDGAMRISTNGDLIAIVEGVNKLDVGEVVKQYGVFTMK
jgi:CRP-like cAMP-binding protein